MKTEVGVPRRHPHQVLQRQITKEDFDLDVNNMQADLDSLKEVLANQITLDNGMVSNLFDPTIEIPDNTFVLTDEDGHDQQDFSQIPSM